MSDWSKGKIYKLICETGKVYIGSTIKEINIRLSIHKNKFNKCVTKDFINPKIELLELFPCNTRDELLWKEREWFEKTDCINLNRPIVSKEEKRLKKNFNSIKYQNLNRSKINEKFTCECGKNYTYANKSRHNKSKKHVAYLAKN